MNTACQRSIDPSAAAAAGGSIRRGRIASAPDAAGLVAVSLNDAPDCARCARGEGCQRLGLAAGRPVTLDCRWPANVPAGEGACPVPAIGQSVDILVPDTGAGWLLPVAIAYGLPTAGLVLGCVLVERLWAGVAMSLPTAGSSAAVGELAETVVPAGPAALGGLAGLIGLAAGVGVSRRLLDRLGRDRVARPCRGLPRIVRVATLPSPSTTGAPVDDDAVRTCP